MVAKLRPAASRNNPDNLMSEQPGAESAAGAEACFGVSPGAAPQNHAAVGDAACFGAPLCGAPQHEGPGSGEGHACGDAGACLEAPLRGAPQHEGGGSSGAETAEPAAASAAAPAPAKKRRVRGSSLPKFDRVEARLDYEAGELSIPKLCEKYGLKRSQLRTVREQGGWVNRPAVAVPRARAGAVGPIEQLLERLRRSLIVQLIRLDARSAGEDPEAQARALTELIRGGSHLVMTERKAKTDKAAEAGPNKKNNDAGRHPSLDPDYLRAELKRRLDRLREGEESGRDH